MQQLIKYNNEKELPVYASVDTNIAQVTKRRITPSFLIRWFRTWYNLHILISKIVPLQVWFCSMWYPEWHRHFAPLGDTSQIWWHLFKAQSVLASSIIKKNIQIIQPHLIYQSLKTLQMENYSKGFFFGF